MEITRLSVSGVGRFASEVVIDGLGPGVNVLAAPNEAGKSTLFRALRACIFERHKSKNDAVKSLISQGTNLPATIAVDFTHEGQDYRITKSFIRSPRASLAKNGREIAKGAAADEKLWDILGIEPMNARSVDQAAFAMLWVGQRDSFTLPAITKAGETVLGAAIESEVGAVAGSDRAKVILAAMQAELARYVTEKTGKPIAQGPLDRACRERDGCRKALDGYSSRLRDLEDQFARLAQLRSEYERHADPAAAAGQERELNETASELRAARQAAERVSAFEADERRCHAQKESAAAKLERLKELAATIASQREREAKLAADVEKLSGEEKALRSKLAEIRSKAKEIDSAEEADASRDRVLEQLAEAATKVRSKAEIERKAGLLAGIIERRTQARGERDACNVTAKTLQSLEQAEREIELLEATLTSSASKLTVALKRGADVPVLIDDREAKHGESLPITSPLTVSIGNIATLTLSPPDGFGADQEKARSALIGQRDKLLRAANVVSLEEARQSFACREALETELKGIDAELNALDVDPDSAGDALAALQKQIARIGAEIAEAKKRAKVEILLEPGTVDEERRDIAKRHEERRRQRKISDATAQEFQGELEAIVTRKGNLSGELDELRRALSANLAASPDESRDAAIAEASTQLDAATTAHQQTAGALADLRGKSPPPEEIERLGNKLARLEQAIANRKTRLAELDRTISNLEGQIQSAGGDGLGERVAMLESQRAQADAEVARHEKRVAVLKLLTETIARALDESRERFYAPVLRHLKPFVNDLFPGAALQLGDSFQVSNLTRESAGAEDFGQLSDGTKEQIAVLVRLAMGALLAEQGRSVPIILDDALVFSDDDRIARMFDALSRAGSRQQIIVLTCRTRAFAALGGRPLQITPN